VISLVDMKAVLVHLDEPTFAALRRVVPAASRQRSRFIRDAIRRAIREAEFARMREAYAKLPDSESDADTWDEPEEYRP
jgi:hypothetical protein